MTNKELAAKLAEEKSISQVEATDTLATIFSTITESLKAGSEVSVSGFGKFESVKQPAKSGTMNGKAWSSKAKQTPKFRPSSTLKDAIA